jgi:hypothetical protein
MERYSCLDFEVSAHNGYAPRTYTIADPAQARCTLFRISRCHRKQRRIGQQFAAGIVADPQESGAGSGARIFHQFLLEVSLVDFVFENGTQSLRRLRQPVIDS